MTRPDRSYAASRRGQSLQPPVDSPAVPRRRRASVLRQAESSFQRQVVEAAQRAGWKVFHPWTSIHSASGYPDLTLARPPRVIFAELKAADGVLTADQVAWLSALGNCPGVETYCWRPVNWADVVRVLDMAGRP